MSYQVNFRLFVCDCSWEEAERAANLQRLLHDACLKVFQENDLHKQVGLSHAEVAHLIKP